jgi:CubicO group peptidase (beta-lactamase class C family)
MVNIDAIERFITAELAGRNHPGSSVAIVKGDKVIQSRGFGYADIRNDVNATSETIYGCASITKPVVTVGFLQLMEQGKFTLDDKVNTHLDAKIKDIKGEEPMIRDLLTHYTGMSTRVPPLYLLGEKADDMKTYIESAARMVRPRGDAWAYCNTAFTIVGHLIKQFTGVEYDRYLVENVLKPLEMTSSDFEITPLIAGGLAQGYKRAGGRDKPLIPNPPYVLGMKPADPAGSLYSTVSDMSKFLIMNMNGGEYRGKRLLKAETIAEMQRLQAPTGKSRSGMGLTWFRTIHDDHVMLYHTGGLPDYTNHLCFYPDEKLGVIWLSNLQDGSSWRPPAPTVLRMALGEEAKPRNLQTPPENWSKITGTYGDETHHISLRMMNGFLILDDRLQLEKLGDSRYMVHGTSNDGEELTFEYSDDGNVTQIDLGTSYYRRYAPEIQRVDTGVELVGKWAGEYYDAHGFHNLNLNIKDRTHATASGPSGEYATLLGFRAELGYVTGQGTFRIPREYARWGLDDYIEVNIDLKAVDRKLIGLLSSINGAQKIILEKK